MTAPHRRSVTSDRVVALLFAAGVGLLGAVLILGTRTQWLLVLAPIGAVIVVIAARWPLLALIVMVVTEVTNLSGVLAPRGGLPLFQASMVLGMVSIALALRDPLMRRRLNRWTGICAGLLGVFVLAQSVALIDSVEIAASLLAIRRTALDCLFVMIVLILIQLTRKPWTVAAAVVIPFAVLSALTLVNQVVFGGSMSFGGFASVTKASGDLITTRRYGGPLPDSNFWGRHLVMGVPLAAALLTRALRDERRRAAVGWGLALAAQFAGVYLTQSRGTFVAAAIAMATWFAISGRSVWRWSPVVVPVAIGFAAIPGVGNRLFQALSEVSQGQGRGYVDPSLLGRIAAQQQAALMWKEEPILGFGPGTFPGQVLNFAGRVPVAVREPTNAPHNIYIELAAESGTLGLLSWLVVVGGFLTVLGLSVTAAPRSRERVLRAAVFGAIIGWSVASLALHMAYFRTFGLMLALAGGLAPAWPLPEGVTRRFAAGAGACAIAGAIGGGVFTAAWSAGATDSVTASEYATLKPVGQFDGWYAYALDVRSRVELLPTVAILLRDADPRVDVKADPVRGLLDFVAAAPTEAEARNEVRSALGRAETTLGSAIGYNDYVLQTVGSIRIGTQSSHSAASVLIASVVGIGAGVASGLLIFGQLVPRREHEPAPEPVPAHGVTA